jgi:predicted DNA-binding transcriptional regulator YafY
MIRKGFLLAIALLLAGCAGLRSPILPDSEPEERQVIQLINYAQRVATMTAEQQRREYSASNQTFARDKDAMSRMRLALLLATPGASVHDAARAASLLEPMAATSDAASPLRSLARLLYRQLNERTSEQKRTNQMRDKLEALKEVERTIMQRGQESQPRRR